MALTAASALLIEGAPPAASAACPASFSAEARGAELEANADGSALTAAALPEFETGAGITVVEALGARPVARLETLAAVLWVELLTCALGSGLELPAALGSLTQPGTNTASDQGITLNFDSIQSSQPRVARA